MENKCVPFFPLLVALCVLGTGCAAPGDHRLGLRIEEAARAGLQREAIEASRFRLSVWHRGLAGAREVTVYLEGDGQAWLTRRRLSDDPTPRNPVGLALAARDPGDAVLYLSRPCQFGETRPDPACDPRFWSSHRYAAEVVDSLDSALDWARRRSGRPATLRFGLVGYSGGGALAALLAARRDDVAWLLTVAANLDTQAWTRHHGLSELDGSLDPVAAAAALRGLPQQHLAGADDEVVPPATRQRFLRAADASERVIEGADHACCWVEAWPQPLCEFLARLPARGQGAPARAAPEPPPGCR